MSSVSNSTPHPGSARPTLRALSIWPSEGGPVRRLRSPSSADEDTSACTNSLRMRQSDFNRNPSRTQPGKRSSVSSTGRRLWPGSRKTGMTLRQESRARAEISAEESRFHKGAGDTTGKSRTACDFALRMQIVISRPPQGSAASPVPPWLIPQIPLTSLSGRRSRGAAG